MEDENVAMVRAGFEAWRERGAEFIGEFLAADIEWEVRPDLPDAATYVGHDGVREVLARFNEVIDDMWIEPQELIPAGEDQVVVPLRWGGRGKGSDVPFEESQETWVFTVRDGRIARVKEYATREEALAAVQD
jgi:ketosteroid isomerase-like protein